MNSQISAISSARVIKFSKQVLLNLVLTKHIKCHAHFPLKYDKMHF